MINYKVGLHRIFNRRIFVFAASLLLVTGLWTAALMSPHYTRLTNTTQNMTFATTIEAQEDSLSLIALGDTGHPTSTQHHVATAMSALATRRSVQMVLLLGDNFYDDGVKSADDPKWESTFETPYELPGLDVPFYAVLGNHDYRSNPQAQVDYLGRTHRWTMPNRYYSFTKPLGKDHEVLFVALDTNTIANNDPAGEQQRSWLRKTMRKSHAQWKIAFGHHPIRSGKDRMNQHEHRMADYMEPVFEEYGMDIYLAGHRHYQSVLKGPGQTLHVISGAGSKPRDAKWNNQTLIATAEPGFCAIDITPTTLFLQLVNTLGESMYSHVITAKAQPPILAHAGESPLAPDLKP